MKITITGATGFVGQALLTALRTNKEFSVTGICRSQEDVSGQRGLVATGNLETADLSDVLQGVDVVIHTAARAHIMSDSSKDPLAEYRLTNVDGTTNLAEQAAKAGVKRLIFISSIKVNGETTQPSRPFRADDTPAPEDAYGISKLEAEKALEQICREGGMEYVIVRPVLVYGPGVKGNFDTMLKWVSRGIPLPFGSIHNQRSLVSLTNLIDFLTVCIQNPKAANETFLISDGFDVSTTVLLRSLATALGKPSRLIPAPFPLLKLCFTVIGKKSIAQRIGDSLQVCIEKNTKVLNWEPKVDFHTALTNTAKFYLSEQQRE